MDVKKNPQADLENKKNIFLEIGFMVALAIVLLAFEWKVSVNEPSDFIVTSEIPADPEMIPVTVMYQMPTPPPPQIKPIDMIEIVEEVTNIDEELELIDVTDNTENSDNNFDIDALNYDDISASDEILPFVPSEDMPVFPGSVQKWIAKNVKYPVLAQENGIEGRVYVQFVVEKDGSVSNIKIARSVDASLDKEAVRVISQMPKWKPGKQRGKAVRVAYTLPITFQLSK